ncbi:YheU family protein [Aeromonas salmonicida]|uniref:YheU family protein n=1 Tax=bacterium 19CA06SA08-2 TaxID=2920658 RepID=A0AAU6U9E2_UNCXX|nr:YheU family protein [Aeromonas salmonicida]
MIIPWQDLDSDTLNNLLEHFVLREGTEYGEHDVSLADKVDEVRQQLKQGLALIVYSELHESINIVSKVTFSSAPVDDIPE